jgi:uncharacterized protein with HEPN domain
MDRDVKGYLSDILHSIELIEQHVGGVKTCQRIPK